MKRIAFAVSMALLASAGASVRAQTINAATVMAIEHWTDAVMHHTPGDVDDAVQSIEKLTMDDRRILNAGMAKFLSALAKDASSGSPAEKRIVDLGLDLSRHPSMSEFLERAAVLHGDAAMFEFKGVIVLPFASETPPGPASANSVTFNRDTASRNLGSAGSGKVPPLLFEGYLPIENDGEVVGITPQDWNWVFARSLLDLLASKHVDNAFIGSWYHATTSFMFWRRLFGEAVKHLERAAVLLPDDARVMFDRACYAEMQGLPRSQQALSDEDLIALRLAGTGGMTHGLANAAPDAKSLGIRPMEVTNAEAERLFRKTLELDPRLFEARVRLARLLMLRAQPADALAILRAAPAGTAPADGMLAFYTDLFTARAERALGHLDAAAEQARQALTLFPDAQSALMASSQIAMLRADVAGAEAPLRHLASLTPDADRRTDPWWDYDIFSGRDAKAIINDMWTQATATWARVPASPAVVAFAHASTSYAAPFIVSEFEVNVAFDPRVFR